MAEGPHSVGIFGGTFNPVHNGHLSIAKSFLRSTLIDELWIFLNPAPPHKPDEHFAPFQTRLKMLQAAFNTQENVVISDLETKMSSPAYTVQTLSYLVDKYQQKLFYLCIGEDSFLAFRGWYRWRKILDYCDLLVAARPTGEDNAADPTLLEHATFVDHQPVDISSTQIRKMIKNGKPVTHLVPPEVSTIIRDHNLYR